VLPAAYDAQHAACSGAGGIERPGDIYRLQFLRSAGHTLVTQVVLQGSQSVTQAGSLTAMLRSPGHAPHAHTTPAQVRTAT
jgi:hypothetical protein